MRGTEFEITRINLQKRLDIEGGASRDLPEGSGAILFRIYGQLHLAHFALVRPSIDCGDLGLRHIRGIAGFLELIIGTFGGMKGEPAKEVVFEFAGSETEVNIEQNPANYGHNKINQSNESANARVNLDGFE